MSIFTKNKVKKLIDENTKAMEAVAEDSRKLQEIIDKQLINKLDKIKELKQDKIYFIHFDGGTREDLDHFSQIVYPRLQKQVNWTLPKILFVNKDFKGYDKKGINKLIQELIKLKKEI